MATADAPRRWPLDAVLALIAVSSVVAAVLVALGVSLVHGREEAVRMPSITATGPDVHLLLTAVDHLVSEMGGGAPQVQAFKTTYRIALGYPHPAWDREDKPNDLVWVVHVSGGKYHCSHCGSAGDQVFRDLTMVLSANDWQIKSLRFNAPRPSLAAGPFETFRNV